MSLVEAEIVDVHAAIQQWRNSPPSRISHHGGACCEIAKEWLTALDHSYRATEHPLSGPSWIAKRYPWGPTAWPIPWCEVVSADSLDCGALADLTREMFTARGTSCFTTQLILRFSPQDIRQWSCKWMSALGRTDWIAGSFVYHETCAVVVREGEINVWDPTDNCWVHPREEGGYGTTAAIRILTEGESVPSTLLWEGRSIEPNVWQFV